MSTELVMARELRLGDRLPYYECSCPCIDGPCEHGPVTWTVVSVWHAGNRTKVRFDNDRDQILHGGWQVVRYEEERND